MHLAACALVALGAAAVAAAVSADPTGALLSSSLIWHAGAAPGDYIVARLEFPLPPNVSAPTLAVFADSRYIAYLNGQRVGAGPERFDWRAPTYDLLPLPPLAPGTNVLAIVAHNYDTCGGAQAPGNMPEVCSVRDPATWWLDTPSGRFMNHVPGLAAALLDGAAAAVLATSPAWRTSNATRYRPSRAVWAAVPDAQDGRVDAGQPAPWAAAGFDARAWGAAAPVDGSQWGPLAPRSVPRLRLTPVPLAPLPPRGGTAAAAFPVTLTAAAPSLVLAAPGQVLARYAVALARASAPGLQLTLTFFERYNATSGALSNSFTSAAYTCAGSGAAEGFETSDVFGGRYLMIELSSPGASGGGGNFSATLTGVTATDERYPFDLVASFAVPGEPFFERLLGMAAATLSVNAADSYTDCSTRERVEWLGDAVINLYNGTRLLFATAEDDGVSVTYGDTRLLRGAVRRALLSSHSFMPNSFQVKAHTCSDRMDFNFAWSEYSMALVGALGRLLAVAGDGAFARAAYADARGVLLGLLARQQLGSGLGLYRETVFFTNPLFLQVTCGTSMNAFAYAALSDGAALASALGYSADAAAFAAAAAALKAALRSAAFNASAGAFAGSVPGDAAAAGGVWPGPGGSGGSGGSAPSPPTAYANFIALAKGVADADGSGGGSLVAPVLAWLLRAEQAPLTAAAAPMAAIQQLTALYDHGGSAAVDTLALNIIRTNWAEMVAAEDVGTLWEFFSGSAGGEVSHNMGAAPVQFLLERVLGIRVPLPLALRVVALEPHLGDLLAAAGVAGTEWGPVGAAWAVTPGAWSPDPRATTRAVTLQVNASLAVALPLPAKSSGSSSAGLTLRIAMPLDGADAPPPASAEALSGACLYVGQRVVNVSQGLASGELALDVDRRYLRLEWVAGGLGGGQGARGAGEGEGGPQGLQPPPQWLGGRPLRGLAAVDSLAVRLAAPPPGSGC